jgi:hypothetical protein
MLNNPVFQLSGHQVFTKGWNVDIPSYQTSLRVAGMAEYVELNNPVSQLSGRQGFTKGWNVGIPSYQTSLRVAGMTEYVVVIDRRLAEISF